MAEMKKLIGDPDRNRTCIKSLGNFYSIRLTTGSEAAKLILKFIYFIADLSKFQLYIRQMRLVIQRVLMAELMIQSKIQDSIQNGLLVLLGICEDDEKEDATWLANKLVQLRIFSDADGKMNLSVIDTNGSLLIVSQFTLFAETKKGNRPSFIRAAKPAIAIPLYAYFIGQCDLQMGKKSATGVFGADMQIHLTNDGPVTIVMDSKNRE